MKTKVEMSDGTAAECPRCGSDDLTIDNVEGLECMECGCWFDTEPDGTVMWARADRPPDLAS